MMSLGAHCVLKQERMDMIPHRLAITPDGRIEATAFNPNSPRFPFRVVIERRSPGNVIEANVPEGSDTFHILVKAARQHCSP
jgi:hypothetical protein